MCGRIALFSPPIRFARLLDATLAAGIDPDGRPSWNVGPQRRLFAVAEHETGRILDRYRWGLVPSWSKDPAVGNRLFNARGETVAEKPSFRSAFARRPCVIPVDGFYEWDHRAGRAKQPHYFTRADDQPTLFAGLFEHWRDPNGPEDAAPLATCTIITTEPGDDMDGIHDRMPVVLDPHDVETWLNVDDHEPGERALLLRPAPRGTLSHHAVDAAVGSVKNDGPELIEPVAPSALF
ncbi:MAG TPA: SOS response-associated peptidase [Acidimicrobiales bacterium]|nr:SOS response-associated peptidase [Acidimicrobiales bacterium]